MHNSLAKAFDLSIDVDERNLKQNSGSLFPIRPKNPCLHVEGTDGRAIPLCSGSGHGRRFGQAAPHSQGRLNHRRLDHGLDQAPLSA
jgi:hypothetical protein